MLTVACPTGQRIARVSFASYGLPAGSCGTFQVNKSCNSANSASLVSTSCVGLANCSIAASNSIFGDPCPGATKSLAVQVECSGTAPTPAPTPTVNSTPAPTPTGVPPGMAYHFSTTDGDDNRTAAQARNAATPWKSLAKLNSIFSTLVPGDVVLFKSGDSFYGSIVAKASGTAAKPILFGAYGSGNKPVITGFSTMSNWTSLGGGIYQANCADCTSAVNLVYVDGVNTAMGRWPNRNASNKGWRAISSHNGNVSFTDNSLPSSPNWTGAEAVVRTSPWTIARNPINNHSGTTVSFNATSNDLPLDGYGYFIQNHPNTLDTFGEWYFEPSTKNFRMYFGSASPAASSVRVASVGTLVDAQNRSYLTFSGISFQGANLKTFNLSNTDSIVIMNSELLGSGDIAISGGSNPRNMRIENCIAADSNNAFLNVDGGGDGAIIRGNSIRNTGVIPGMGVGQSLTGINFSYSNNLIIERNRLINTGYNGIHFLFGGNIDINSNVVDGFDLEKDDGAGIYTWNAVGNAVEYTGVKIRNNIVQNGKSAPESRSEKGYTPANGIYMDDNAGGVELTGNTVANNAGSGFFLHNAHNLIVNNNLSYNNGPTAPYSYGDGQMMIFSNSGAYRAKNITMSGNQFIAKSPNQLVLKWDTDFDDVRQLGSVNDNIYARPASDSVMSRIIAGGMEYFFSLANWRTYSGYDSRSKTSPMTITDPNVLRFEVNDSATPKVIALDRTYIAINGTVYTSSITLPAFSSVVLIPQ